MLPVCTGALLGSLPRELICVAGAAWDAAGFGTAADMGLRNAGAEKGFVVAAATGWLGRAGAEKGALGEAPALPTTGTNAWLGLPTAATG